MTTAQQETFPTATLEMSEQTRYTISLCDQYPQELKDAHKKYSKMLDKTSVITGETVGAKRWATRYLNQFIGLCEWHGFDNWQMVQWRFMIAENHDKL